jgi:hypothetical protein
MSVMVIRSQAVGQSLSNPAANHWHGGFTDSGLGRAPAFPSGIVNRGLVLYGIMPWPMGCPSFVMGRESTFSGSDSEKREII